MIITAALGFVAFAFCACFVSFACCYWCMPGYSFRGNGQMRSLSGIMKCAELKPFFSFVMGCLGGALVIASGLRGETAGVWRELMLFFLLGMYVSLIGLVLYDVGYSKAVHYSFVFSLIFFGYGFGNYLLWCDISPWCSASAVAYNVLVSIFLAVFLVNSVLRMQGLTEHRTPQACLEILWVVCLVVLMCVYAFEENGTRRNNKSVLLGVCLGATVLVCLTMAAVFYITPELGFNAKGGVNYLCSIIAKTNPHFAFPMQVMFGLLALSLCLADMAPLAIVLYVCATGFLSFGVGTVHNCFVFGFTVDVLVFGILFYLDGGGIRRVAGTVHIATVCVCALSALLCRITSIAAISSLQIVWILSIAVMFGLVICS